MLPIRAAMLLAAIALASSVKAEDLRDLPALSADPKALFQAAAAVPKSADTEAVIVLSDLRYSFEADGRYRLTERRIVLGSEDFVQDGEPLDVVFVCRHLERPEHERRPSRLASGQKLNVSACGESHASLDASVQIVVSHIGEYHECVAFF
jgi:hypothetical protein